MKFLSRARKNDSEELVAVKPKGVKDVFFNYIRQPEFKRLLNEIANAQSADNFKSVSVLSEFAGEGKTFFVSVLALGYASFLKKKVLIMDTISQTRNESFYISSVLNSEDEVKNEGAPPSAGLIDLITTRNLKRQATHQRLSIANTNDKAFRENESEDYDTADFQIGTFIASLKASYDLILMDTCALNDVTIHNIDPIILAHQSDRSILITSKYSINRETISKFQKELIKTNINVLGTVYNSNV